MGRYHANSFDGLRKQFTAYAKVLCPIPDFVLFLNIDANAVLDAAIFNVIDMASLLRRKV